MKTNRAPSAPPPFAVPAETAEILAACPGYRVAETAAELAELAVFHPHGHWDNITYEVPGKGWATEACVCRVRNGIAVTFPEAYMRQRDWDSMVIGDDRPTDKTTYAQRFGAPFGPVRQQSLDWLKGQRLIVFAFIVGWGDKGLPAVAVVPENAGFYAYGLALMHGIVRPAKLPAGFTPRAVLYVAPPFRHTHFHGRQVAVHNRRESLHEVFAYHLYPGPTAKTGAFSLLLDLGETERWLTTHCSTVQVVTPYDNKLVIMHEGASGSGKSEMLEHARRLSDGSLVLGRNLLTGETRHLTLPQGCELRPVVDDMALCHPSLDKGRGKLTLVDAEKAWFIRLNHVTAYGADPQLEALTIHPPEPLLFLNIDTQPGATALVWDHVEDRPGERCPNPRVFLPRHHVPHIVDGAVDVDVRSFGLRCPPCTAARPTYGILGLFHILPPALAWLWRLVAPRGHADPHHLATAGIESAGVGSYWASATGRRVDHANLLLNQILETPGVRYMLIPNQHIGAWKVGFMPQWAAREYLARRAGAGFTARQVRPARCPLLGYTPVQLVVEGREVPPFLLATERQPEVGEAAYDRGAELLAGFFDRELRAYLQPGLVDLGRRIIECCLRGGTVEDYARLIDYETLAPEE